MGEERRESGPRPAAGVRVIDLSPFMPGHYASTLLADLGATVVQIEPPGGLPARQLPGLFESTCRNRQSLAVDLKHADGKQVLRRLAARSDVVIEGFRPGVAARLETDYASLAAENPGLIYCSISGFGQEGPRREWMGHDCNYVSISGAMAVFADPTTQNRLEPFGLPIGDLVASLHAVIGVLAALLQRRESGRGQFLDVAIADGPLSFVVPRVAEYLLTGSLPKRGITRGIFRTGDGRFLSMGVVEDHSWRALCKDVEREDLVADGRFRTFADRYAHAEELEAIFTTIFRQRTLAEWESRLDGKAYSWAPVRTMVEAFAEPHVLARELVQKLSVRGQEVPVLSLPVKGDLRHERATPPPGAGEHGRDILSELGYSDEEIRTLARRGVVAL